MRAASSSQFFFPISCAGLDPEERPEGPGIRTTPGRTLRTLHVPVRHGFVRAALHQGNQSAHRCVAGAGALSGALMLFTLSFCHAFL